MDQEAVYPTIAILKGVQKDETIGDGRGLHHRRHMACFHAFVGSEQTLHQVG